MKKDKDRRRRRVQKVHDWAEKSNIFLHIQVVISSKAKGKKMRKPLSSLETLMASLVACLLGLCEKSLDPALAGLVSDSETGKRKANPGRLAICRENAQLGPVFHRDSQPLLGPFAYLYNRCGPEKNLLSCEQKFSFKRQKA